MADDGEHSLFSASGADGWSVCYGKPAMEMGRKTSSAFADEGTAAHDLGARVLRNRLDGGDDTAAKHRGEKITVKREGGTRSFTVSQEMAEHVDDYVDRCVLLAEGAVACGVETRVRYHEHLGVEERLAFGTCDFWAVFSDGRVVTVDLKYGAGVLVEIDGFQQRLYAAGIIWELDYLGVDFTELSMNVCQPRKDWYPELSIKVGQLLNDLDALREAVPHVLDAMRAAQAAREVGATDLEVGVLLNTDSYLKTSEKACRFCDAKAVCPMLLGDVTEAFAGKRSTADDFADLTVETPEQVREYGGNYLAFAAARLAQIDEWTKAVRAEIDRRILIHGEQIDGFKVVAGKRGSRAWNDQGEAEAWAARTWAQKLFKTVLMTPTQALAALKNQPPELKAQLLAITNQADGKPAVVPDSDPRAPISHRATADDFEDETQQPPADGRAAGEVERHPFR